jgi:hypothetical protein
MLLVSAVAVAVAALALDARAWQEPQAKRKLGYTDTPMLPGGKWRVHDGTRPQPKVVTAGTSSTPDAPGRPPSDAVVLFDGKDLSRWHGDRGKPSGWKVEDGAMVAVPKAGSVISNDEFGDCQLHVEWASPDPPKGIDQGRGNSGVLIFGRYEIQVLDSFDSLTYPDGQAAAIYGQYPPLVNACRKPGEWQTYDIIFTAPRFKADGSVETPAHVTLLHNGVLVHNHTPLIGAMAFRKVGQYTPHGRKGPIMLQDHGNPVRFRNIWVREIKGYDEP